ncbi:MAG: hypothetical protein GY944_11420 [bacterium]|nr:hypothetical protein [bacterium]
MFGLVTYVILDGIVLFTMRGRYDATEMATTFRDAKTDPAYESSMSFVIDGSAADTAVFNPDEVRGFGSFAAGDPERAGNRVALVPTPGAANFGMTRMSELLIDSEREVRLFESLSDALRWAKGPDPDT